MPHQEPIDLRVVDGRNQAVGERLHRCCFVAMRQDVTVQVAEIAWILERMDLPAAVFESLVCTGDAREEHCRMLGRTGRPDHICARAHERPRLEELDEHGQFAIHPIVIELRSQGCSRNNSGQS